MADILFMDEGKIYFEGFEFLKDKAYIIFRNGGIFISGEAPANEYRMCEFDISYIEDIKVIENSELEKKLTELGFGKGNGDIFIKVSVPGKKGRDITAYMSEYPK